MIGTNLLMKRKKLVHVFLIFLNVLIVLTMNFCWSKLNKYGILNTKLKLFSSFLSGRKQAVYCHGKLSESKDITIGIPQGSILGPSLFLVFLNDITDC